MTIEEIEIYWNQNRLSYDEYMPRLIAVAKAAKSIYMLERHVVTLQESLEELEKE